MTRKASKNMTFERSSEDSSNAPIIFLRPGSLDTDRSGRSTLKLLSADKLGKIGITETMLVKEMESVEERVVSI